MKILLVSPTPTHPQNAGNRIRIFKIVEFLREQEHHVSFVYSNQEKDCDIGEMRSYFGNDLYVVDYLKPAIRKKNKWIDRVLNKLNKDRQYYSNIDDFYNQNLDSFLQDLISKNIFDCVILIYIFLTKAFLNFPASTLKVLDTQDVMANRHRLFLENGKKPSWYSTSAAEEKKGLDRADHILSIQDNEKNHFSKLTSKPVTTIGHMVDIFPLKYTTPPRKKILFLGSSNPSNVFGIQTFITEIFPAIRKSIPDLELIIVGTICSKIMDQEGIVKMGEMPNLKSIYDLSDIVINPLTIGTGLKIKSIEALGFSKALISTTVGADGLEDGINSAFLLANNAEEFCTALNSIIYDSEKYLTLCNNATKFVEKWNKNIKDELQYLLSSK